MELAFDYMQRNGGIATAATYPFVEKAAASCKAPLHTEIDVRVEDTVDIASGDEGDLQAAIARVGPVAVSLDASHESFMFYKAGVYEEVKCRNGYEDLNHAMLAVGYGTDENGVEYWLMKNSWGVTWGEAGFVKMPRSANNTCGIATSACYPLVVRRY